MKNYKIAVAGTGYVGLSLGVLLSQHHQVVAVDIVQAKVDMINNKKSPIQDDYIEKYLAEKDLNLTATLDAKVACYRYRHNFNRMELRLPVQKKRVGLRSFLLFFHRRLTCCRKAGRWLK